MSNVAPSGITGNTSFGRLINEPELVEKSKRALEYLFEVTGAEKHGFFTADFKEDDNGTAYLTEINARMVAFNLSFAKAGANFAEDIIRLVQDDQERFLRGYLIVSEIVAILSVVLCSLSIINAEVLVIGLFGAKWAPPA